MNLKCIFGHRWNLVGIDRMQAIWFGHIYHYAGMDLVCERCGRELLDAHRDRQEVNPPMRLWGREYRQKMKMVLKEYGV